MHSEGAGVTKALMHGAGGRHADVPGSTSWVLHLDPSSGYNNNNNRRLVTLAEHTSDHGKQTNSSTDEKVPVNNNNNNRRLVTLAEHTSDHGRQTNSSTEEKGEQV